MMQLVLARGPIQHGIMVLYLENLPLTQEFSIRSTQLFILGEAILFEPSLNV
jgi:hypothetical protein